MEQLLADAHGIVLSYVLRRMCSLIAHLLDSFGLVKEWRWKKLLECWFMDKCAQGVLIWASERLIMFVQPINSKFQCQSGIEATPPWI